VGLNSPLKTKLSTRFFRRSPKWELCIRYVSCD